MRQKKLPLPFNETERNGLFNETERAVHDPFFIRSRSVRSIAQSALARGSL